MKLKYFLRGLGAGIIFGAVIMLAAYMLSRGYKLSDEEIIAKAEKLGMVMAESAIEESATEEATTEDARTEETTTEEATTEEATTEETTTEEATTEEATNETDEVGTELVKATITVSSGMGSETVASLMQSAGIIESASDFDSYLNKNGYSTKIEIGTYEMTDKMSYEELAEILIKGN